MIAAASNIQTKRRRSASFSPFDLGSNLYMYFQAGTGYFDATTGGSAVTTDGATIARWVDLAALANHALMPTAGSRPFFRTNVFNGFPGVDFVVNRLFGMTSIAGIGSGGANVFYVLKKTTGNPDPSGYSGLSTIGADASNFTTHYPYSDGNVYDTTGTDTRKATGAAPITLTNPHLYEVKSVPGEWTNRYNGTVGYTTATNTPAWSASPALGESLPAAYAYYGLMAEFAIVLGGMTKSDRNSMRSYFASKFALTVALEP